jgi:general secretion pathway protein G
MIKRFTQMREDERGFTLIELLIVIVILGILAAIVIFSVGGITDKGQSSACDTDKKTVETAEEAYFAQPAAQGGGDGNYATEAQLVPKFLHEESKWYKVTPANPTSSFSVVVDGSVANNPCT